VRHRDLDDDELTQVTAQYFADVNTMLHQQGLIHAVFLQQLGMAAASIARSAARVSRGSPGNSRIKENATKRMPKKVARTRARRLIAKRYTGPQCHIRLTMICLVSRHVRKSLADNRISLLHDAID
jgi:hypothetical protein